MADTVSAFRAVEPPPAENVIDVCRELLARAEAGRITSLVFVAGGIGGDVVRGYALTDGTPLLSMVGAASILHLRLMDEVSEAMADG